MAILCSDWLDTLVKPINSELYMKELKMPEDSRKVTVYTAYIGMKVKLKDDIAIIHDCYDMCEITQISGEFDGIELHSHHCVVKTDTTGIELILNIGYDNEFDLLSVNDSNDKHTQKSINVMGTISKTKKALSKAKKAWKKKLKPIKEVLKKQSYF